MMNGYLLLAGAIFVLLILSAFFSGSETALTRASLPRMHALARQGHRRAELDVPAADPEAVLGSENVRRDALDLPELSEVEVVRHFPRLSTWNAAVDLSLYPLGSCTMKYNPKVNEWAARLSGFARITSVF